MRVKIIGAGSIGNHLAQASRRMGWEVCVVDSDPEALRRMKESIYPTRYKKWDDSIELYVSGSEPRNDFDIIMIGTPPDVRAELAVSALREEPRILLLEKPLFDPSVQSLDQFKDAYYRQNQTVALVGYDHAVSPSVGRVCELISSIGKVQTIDVEFREHWEGIFNAHPWLSGPQDSYLGFRSRGGGAACEHSHALHLWNLFSKVAGHGSAKLSTHLMQRGPHPATDYDEITLFNLVARDMIGRVVQDVITKPVRKWARIQGTSGAIEWCCNVPGRGDVVTIFSGVKKEEIDFPKTRPDDFLQEMLEIESVIKSDVKAEESPISIESGLAVMNILISVHKK